MKIKVKSIIDDLDRRGISGHSNHCKWHQYSLWEKRMERNG